LVVLITASGLSEMLSMPCSARKGRISDSRWAPAADADFPAFDFRRPNRLGDEAHDSRIAFIEQRRHYIRIPVHSQRELRLIFGADGKSIAQLSEFLGEDDVAGNFEHEIDLDAPLNPPEPVPRHLV
jgi:hypothetical protein